MRRTLGLGLASGLGLAAVALPTFVMPLGAVHADVLVPRVINGSPGSPISAVAVSIELPEGYCTAALWKPRVLVTAAHCINGDGGGAQGVSASSIQVFTPGGDRRAGPSPVKVSRIVYDPNWKQTQDDIAFLVLDAPLGTPVIARLALAAEIRQLAAQHASATYVGYGQTAPRNDPDAPISSVPLSLAQPLADSSGSGGTFELVGDGVRGTCAGDSGGPFVATIGPELVLLGPLSGGFGRPCESDDDASSDEAAIAAEHGDLIATALAAVSENAEPMACASGPDIESDCAVGHSWVYDYCWSGRRAVLQEKVGGSWRQVSSTTARKSTDCGRAHPYDVRFSVMRDPGAYQFRVVFARQPGIPRGAVDPFTLKVT